MSTGDVGSAPKSGSAKRFTIAEGRRARDLAGDVAGEDRARWHRPSSTRSIMSANRVGRHRHREGARVIENAWRWRSPLGHVVISGWWRGARPARFHAERILRQVANDRCSRRLTTLRGDRLAFPVSGHLESALEAAARAARRVGGAVPAGRRWHRPRLNVSAKRARKCRAAGSTARYNASAEVLLRRGGRHESATWIVERPPPGVSGPINSAVGRCNATMLHGRRRPDTSDWRARLGALATKATCRSSSVRLPSRTNAPMSMQRTIARCCASRLSIRYRGFRAA